METNENFQNELINDPEVKEILLSAYDDLFKEAPVEDLIKNLHDGFMWALLNELSDLPKDVICTYSVLCTFLFDLQKIKNKEKDLIFHAMINSFLFKNELSCVQDYRNVVEWMEILIDDNIYSSKKAFELFSPILKLLDSFLKVQFKYRYSEVA